MFNKRSKRYNIKILIFIFLLYIMNPIGNTGFMSAPPPSYTDYFNSLKSTPKNEDCLLYTSPSPRDRTRSRMPSSA